MTGFFSTCFDQTIDPNAARVMNVAVNLKTGDLVGDRMVSKYFVESAMLYQLGAVRSMGFVRDAGHTRFAVTWVNPADRTECWAELNLVAGTYHSNARGAARHHGFGLVGIGAGLIHPASNIRDTWTAFLVKMQTAPGLEAVDSAVLGPIAISIADALTGKDITHGEGDGWKFVEPTVDKAPPDIEDFKDRLLTVGDFIDLIQYLETDSVSPTRFQGTQLRNLRGLIRRRKHVVLLGPPGVGKTMCAFEALTLEQFKTKGVDYQIFMGHDDVKSSDLLGAWQSTDTAGVFRFVIGPLVRAMTANGGRGQPILVEEFLRMPRRAQNVFITALSDGYLVLNEKPDDEGKGELIVAGPDFVFIADMNMDAAADDLELYGAAFSSRVRKLIFGYPSESAMLHILADANPATTSNIRTAVVASYTRVMTRFNSSEVSAPLSPRSCIHWVEEIMADLPTAALQAESVAVRTSARAGAQVTWLTDVAGFQEKDQKPILDDIEAQFRKVFGVRPMASSN